MHRKSHRPRHRARKSIYFRKRVYILPREARREKKIYIFGVYSFVFFLMIIIHQILVQNLTQTPQAPRAALWQSLEPLTMFPSTPHASQPSGQAARGFQWFHLALEELPNWPEVGDDQPEAGTAQPSADADFPWILSVTRPAR